MPVSIAHVRYINPKRQRGKLVTQPSLTLRVSIVVRIIRARLPHARNETVRPADVLPGGPVTAIWRRICQARSPHLVLNDAVGHGAGLQHHRGRISLRGDGQRNGLVGSSLRGGGGSRSRRGRRGSGSCRGRAATAATAAAGLASHAALTRFAAVAGEQLVHHASDVIANRGGAANLLTSAAGRAQGSWGLTNLAADVTDGPFADRAHEAQTGAQGFGQAQAGAQGFGQAQAGAQGFGQAQAGAQGFGQAQAGTQGFGASQQQFTLPQRWQANRSCIPLNRSHW